MKGKMAGKSGEEERQWVGCEGWQGGGGGGGS